MEAERTRNSREIREKKEILGNGNCQAPVGRACHRIGKPLLFHSFLSFNGRFRLAVAHGGCGAARCGRARRVATAALFAPPTPLPPSIVVVGDHWRRWVLVSARSEAAHGRA